MGEGPYPTEIHGSLAEELRKVGAEYGTTTGRPRRIGWLDIPALQYVTRCDVDNDRQRVGLMAIHHMTQYHELVVKAHVAVSFQATAG